MAQLDPEAAAKRALDKAAIAVERDLSILTGPELLAKYGKAGSAAYITFGRVVGRPVSEVATGHNPFWHYCLAVWFDNPDGAAMLSAAHRRLADLYLNLALGKLDDRDGVHAQLPRRGLKSTFKQAFADWAPKRHKIVDKLDVTVLYTHNSDRQATMRMDLIKRKNRFHPYIERHFPRFQVPKSEWGTQAEWDWPCRDTISSVAEKSMTAMSAAAKKAGRGYNYKLLDDWEDEDSRYSDAVREQLSANYDQLRALKTIPWSREVSSGTPYHIHGLYKPFLESKHKDGTPRYATLLIPALDADQKPNFPNIPALTVDSLARERANEIERTGSDIFWFLQYQLDPRQTGTQAMEWAWFQSLTPEQYRTRYAGVAHFRCVFVDSAWKGGEGQGKGDSTAIAAIGIWHIGNRMERVLLDLTVSRDMTSDKGAEEVCRMMKKWGTNYYAAEHSGENTFYGIMKLAARANRLYPVEIPLGGWTKKRKAERIAALAGGARSCGFYYLADLPNLPALRAQIQDYPQVAHEDIVDCLANSYAEEVARRWVPVGLELGEPVDPLVGPIARPHMITRYSGIPAFS